ncbi:MAG TPA: HPr family phosphocarrier protein [Candidatus Limnocylindrales bacterium]|nr:HPr family phosphocarrier protein [Candidatus Limnocylindrales bacterium]
MKQKRTAEIKNELGLHARAAAMLVKTSNKYKAKLILTKDDQQVNGKSIMGVLTLAAAKGSRITLEAEGEDASEMLEELTQLIENGFGEK